MATTKIPRLTAISDAELGQLLGLVKRSDTVELKLTVPASGQRSAVASLKMDPLEAQIRQVFFFDTPDLTLNEAGVVVRARRKQGKSADTVVKLRPVDPDDLPTDLRKSPSLGVEVDAMPGGYVCSASLKGKTDNSLVRAVTSGEQPARKLFSKEQRAFLAAHAPDGTALDDLTIMGPLFALKLEFTPDDFRPMVAELWLYPDGSRILELSTKCAPGEMFQVAMEGRAFLAGRGVDLDSEQQTKTKTALEFYATELQDVAAN
jgi:hypothetical protein